MTRENVEVVREAFRLWGLIAASSRTGATCCMRETKVDDPGPGDP
ncbi:MAG TPA: hypothetical protein VIZ61_03950 [Solirubrobacterales bacterium]